MTTPIHSIVCTKNELIARDIYECRFTKPEGFTFTPGQFVLLNVPLVDDETDIQPRAFSIASSPDEEELIFVIKMIEGGRAGQWIKEKLEAGVVIEMMGPFGVFTLNSESNKDYLMICTCTGIAPYRSQLLTILPKGESRRIDLVFGVRNEENLFWKEEFEELARTYENFSVYIVLSRPSDEWKGHRGHVQEVIPQIISDFTHKNVMVCGNPDMTKEVKELCVEEWGVDKQDIHMEGYI
jgi:NAD(P)H-flavin reductase